VVDGVVTSYDYTSDGIRSRVSVDGVTADYIVDSMTDYIVDSMTPSGYAQVVEELASGVLAVRYTYVASLDPVSESRNGSTSVYLADGHSGVRQAISLAGAVLMAQRFDAYGVSVAKVGTLNTPIGYRGERFDATLGQYYLRARYYDPRQGRFTGMDPFQGNYSDTSQAMRYGYAGGNPIWGMDPSGRFSIGSIAVTSAIGGGLVGLTTGAMAGYKRGGINQAVLSGIVGALVGAAVGVIAGTSLGYLAKYAGRSSLIIREFFYHGGHFRSATVPFVSGFAVGAIIGAFAPETGFFGALLAANFALDSILVTEYLRGQWASGMRATNPNIYNYWNNVLGTENQTGRAVTRRNWARGVGTAVYAFSFGYLIGYLTGLTARTVVIELEAKLPTV
jgi:RHS repeat-associated protein